MTCSGRIIQGDACKLHVKARTIDGDIIGLSGISEIKFALFQDPEDILMEKSLGDDEIVVSDDDGGEFDVVFETGDTDDLAGVYFFEVKITDSEGRMITLKNQDQVSFPYIEVIPDVITS